jgi:transposase-like protein
MAKKEPDKEKPDKALTTRKVGRPPKYIYSPELADTIYDLMVEGMDMVEACKALGLNRGTVYRWKDQYPEFESLCARAREAMMEKRLSDLRTSIKKAKKDKEDPTWFKVELSFEQWNAERVAPRLYAPKNKTEVTGKDGAPIQIQQHTIIDSRNLTSDEREMLRQVLLAAQSREEDEENDE